MKKNNRLDKTFGPMAFAGVILFILPLSVPFFDLAPVIAIIKENDFGEIIITLLIYAVLLLPGAFIGFTTACTRIDYENKRIKYGTKLFGVIFIGKWTNLTPNMKLGLKVSTERWGAYSRSNRSTSLEYNDLKIFLYDAKRTEIIPVKKIKKEKFAEAELEKLSKLLNLNIIK